MLALISRGEVSDLFACEWRESLDAFLGNLDQTAFGEPIYLSIEANAAHLLYFDIKSHPFAGGNKHSDQYTDCLISHA